MEELAILRLIAENLKITQKALAVGIGKSERTAKRLTVSRQEKGYIRRIHGRRNGIWELL